MNKTEAKLKADAIKMEADKDIAKRLERATKEMEDLGFTHVQAKAEFSLEGVMGVNPERALKANYGGQFDTGNARDEFFVEVQIGFYPNRFKNVEEASEASGNQIVLSGDMPGREPGFHSGTFTDIGCSLLTAWAACKALVCADHLDPHAPNVFISIIRDNGETYEFDGPVGEAFIAINDTLQGASIVDAFSFVGVENEFPDHESRTIPVEDPARPLYTDDLEDLVDEDLRSAKATEEDEKGMQRAMDNHNGSDNAS